MKPLASLLASFALSVVPGTTGPPSDAASSSAHCRCLAGQPCWPSPSAFSALSSQLSQPLIHPVPPAAACYPASAPSGDCATVQQHWMDGNWHSNRSGSMQAPNFDNFIFKNGTISACYLDASLGAPCEQGSVPVVGVDARIPEDVQAAVKFAAKHNLRVVIKNTGHDFLGRSTARGSFLIWTHHMKNITFHESFKPAGSPRSVLYDNVITLGAGVQWGEAYAAVFSHGRDIVGGISAGGSVGAAGGWMQGGGHSILSRTYGLGVDNAVEITVVTADGSHVTANAYQNSDLFWALRGGGGGTFGVATSVTYKTHPSTPLIAAFFNASIDTTVPNATLAPSPTLEKLFTEFVRLTPSMSDGGWAGYGMLVPTAPTFAVSLQFFYLAVNQTWEDANKTMNPFFDFAQDLAANSTVESGGQLNIVSAGTYPGPSFAQFYEQLFVNATGQVGTNVELASRLVPRKTLEDDHENVARTLLSLPLAQYYLLGGGKVAETDPSSAGLNPAWRDSLVHTLVGIDWPEGASAAAIEEQRQQLKSYVATLHGLAPNSGAYLNEASLYEIDPQYTFFGTHYQKLKAIKKKWDPHSLFIVAEGVGSEEWDRSLNCRR